MNHFDIFVSLILRLTRFCSKSEFIWFKFPIAFAPQNFGVFAFAQKIDFMKNGPRSFGPL